MNIYITAPHRRPFLFGTTEADIEAAKALGLNVDLLIHPGGKTEWAICLGRHDDPARLPDWKPVWAEPQTANSLRREVPVSVL